MKQKLLLLIFAVLSLTTTYSQESLVSKITESYDSFSDTYSLSDKEEYTYHPTGDLKMIKYFSWNGSSWDENNYRNEYFYDANGNLTDDIVTYWNGSQWVNFYKTTTGYNVNQIIAQTYYNWDGTQWVPEDKTDLNYVANVLDNYDSFLWDGSQWIDDARGVFTFNAGKLSNYTTDSFITGAWVLLTDNNTFTRNGLGQLEEQIYQEDTGSGLEDQEQYNYIVDTNGNRLEESDATSTNGGATWNPDSKTEYGYNMSELITSYNHPFNIDSFFYDLELEDFPHNNKVLTSMEYDYNSGWEVTYRSTYQYSNDPPLGIEEFNITDTNIYPNPVKDVLNIELINQTNADASLFDTNGRLFIKQKLQNLQTPINLETLSSGVYVLKIQTENGFATKRIVKN
jgi:hypothetical protein